MARYPGLSASAVRDLPNPLEYGRLKARWKPIDAFIYLEQGRPNLGVSTGETVAETPALYDGPAAKRAPAPALPGTAPLPEVLRAVVDEVLGFLKDGHHVLLAGAPGTGKTTMVPPSAPGRRRPGPRHRHRGRPRVRPRPPPRCPLPRPRPPLPSGRARRTGANEGPESYDGSIGSDRPAPVLEVE